MVCAQQNQKSGNCRIFDFGEHNDHCLPRSNFAVLN